MLDLLIVEDDPLLSKMMEQKLQKDGYHTHLAFNGIEALDIMDHQHIDLMILDIMMPKMDGYTLADTLRKANASLPILMVTAKKTMEAMEKGFELGVDDYLVKPFMMKELSLRVMALLRRAKIAADQKIELQDFQMDYTRMVVTTAKGETLLPPKEFQLLYLLLSYPGRIFTRQSLLDEIWGYDVEVDDRTVDSHIKKIRKRYEDHPSFDIITIRGIGYKIEVRSGGKL